MLAYDTIEGKLLRSTLVSNRSRLGTTCGRCSHCENSLGDSLNQRSVRYSDITNDSCAECDDLNTTFIIEGGHKTVNTSIMTTRFGDYFEGRTIADAACFWSVTQINIICSNLNFSIQAFLTSFTNGDYGLFTGCRLHTGGFATPYAMITADFWDNFEDPCSELNDYELTNVYNAIEHCDFTSAKAFMTA